uniref:Uncharacterized protein n=1 Tax=Romanomermis culicivorax TaxID=13658 RepID=A0A915IKN7_ROMCU
MSTMPDLTQHDEFLYRQNPQDKPTKVHGSLDESKKMKTTIVDNVRSSGVPLDKIRNQGRSPRKGIRKMRSCKTDECRLARAKNREKRLLASKKASNVLNTSTHAVGISMEKGSLKNSARQTQKNATGKKKKKREVRVMHYTKTSNSIDKTEAPSSKTRSLAIFSATTASTEFSTIKSIRSTKMTTSTAKSTKRKGKGAGGKRNKRSGSHRKSGSRGPRATQPFKQTHVFPVYVRDNADRSHFMNYGNQLSEGHFCNNSCGFNTSDGYSRFLRLGKDCIFLYANGQRYDTFKGFCELETSVAEFSKDCRRVRSWGNANQQKSLHCKDVYEDIPKVTMPPVAFEKVTKTNQRRLIQNDFWEYHHRIPIISYGDDGEICRFYPNGHEAGAAYKKDCDANLQSARPSFKRHDKRCTWQIFEQYYQAYPGFCETEDGAI